jgi:non-lysosomal glucosylceramidase
MHSPLRPQWQTKPYKHQKTSEISFPLGGLGTGCIGLAGNGRLIDWEMANKPNKKSLNGISHFAVKAEKAGKLVDARILHGDLAPPYSGGFDSFGQGPRHNNLAGLPHFQNHSFRGEFPFAEIEFSDPVFPGEIKLFAFNPLIPSNEKDSGLPAAFFEMELKNNGPDSLDYTVVGVLSNPAGQKSPVNAVEHSEGRTMLRLASTATDEGPGQGEMILATDATSVSYQEYFYRGHACDDLQMYWNELTGSPRFKNRTYAPGKVTHTWGDRDAGLIAARVALAPGESTVVRFILSWHFPNVKNDWDSEADERAKKASIKNLWKNWYATEWKDARAVTIYAFEHWETFLRDTIEFHDALYRSTLPPVVLEAVSANISILKSPTVSRLEDGTFYGWEGVNMSTGSCEGSCTHVWNYAMALPFLFPRLERSMRDANYRYNVDAIGGSHFRLRLPLGLHNDKNSFRPCADGQFGDVIKTYRDWKISGDTKWLSALWPQIKKAMAYAWSSENSDRWDPEKTGVLWGRQHHTLDSELFGPNSWLTGFYLGALKACAEMGLHLQDRPFAEECRDLFQRGKLWVDENLFHHNYYGQKLDLKNRKLLAAYDGGDNQAALFEGKITDAYWSEEAGEIKHQIGEGCGIDAVVAQWHANLCALGDLFDPEKVKATLRSIFAHNFENSSRALVNPWRSFRLNDEAGVAICAWPAGSVRPAITLPCATESMTGFEYAFAALLIQNGMMEEGVACVKAVRDRYDGEKRNPWNEFECGSNYARAMASYSLLNAFSGFEFDGIRHRLGFRPPTALERFQCFWSLDSAWGEVEITPDSLRLVIARGQIMLHEFLAPFIPSRVEFQGRDLNFKIVDGLCELREKITLRAGEQIDFHR